MPNTKAKGAKIMNTEIQEAIMKERERCIAIALNIGKVRMRAYGGREMGEESVLCAQDIVEHIKATDYSDSTTLPR
jgi:hypothetical protein